MVDHDSLPEELERSSPELPQLVTDPEFRALGPPFRPEGRNQVATITRDYPPSAIALAAPPMSEAEYQELKDNITAHGLRNPIVLIGNRILDGLHRLRACKELGIPPRYIEWKSRRRGDSAVAYAAGQHTRRNLSPQQKAMYAAKLANMRRGRPSEGKLNPPRGGFSQAQAANAMNAKLRSVQRAAVVLKANIPRLTDFVARNLVPLETAERFVRLEQKFAKMDECGFWFYGGTYHERIDEATFSRRNRAASRNARQAAATGNSRNEDRM